MLSAFATCYSAGANTNCFVARICASVLTLVSVTVPLLDRCGNQRLGHRRDATWSRFASNSSPSFSLLSKNTCVRFAHHFQWAHAPMVDFAPPPAHTEILLALGGKRSLSPEPPFAPLLQFHEFPQSATSKKKRQPGEGLPRIPNDKIQNSKGKPTFYRKSAPCIGRCERFRFQGVHDEAKRKDSPARRCLEFQMTKSKTQKENQLSTEKALHSPDGLDGSGFRARMIQNVLIGAYLTVNRNAIHMTTHLISCRMRQWDDPHIRLKIPKTMNCFLSHLRSLLSDLSSLIFDELPLTEHESIE